MKRIILVFLVVSFFQGAKSQTEKIEKIKTLIEILNPEERMIKNLNEIIGSQIEYSTIDSMFWDEYKTRFYSLIKDSINPLLISIYDKYYTAEEITAMYTFYSTDIGKKTLVKSDSLLKDFLVIGAKYGQRVVDQIFLERTKEIEKDLKYKMNYVHSGCDKFRAGRFKCVINDSTVIYYDRTLEKQTESLGNGTADYKINWLSDCRYELVLEKIDNSFVNANVGLKVIVNIYEINGNTYKFAVQQIGNNNISLGELIKME
jgi:hypothetical protein